MSFANADAYTQRFPFLSRLVLRQGVVDFAANIPPADTTLIATTAAVLVRADAHSALVNLLAQALARGARPAGGRCRQRGPAVPARRRVPDGRTIPSSPCPRTRAASTARAPPFLQRYMPFWVATMLDRLMVSFIVLLPILIPLLRFAPQIYNWRIRRRIMYWYGELKRLEAAGRSATTAAERAAKLGELDRIEAAVDNIPVPLGFADRLYELRQHIEGVRRRLTAGTAPAPAAG